MPLETATYIDQLVTSNPAHSDGLNDADAHMRMLKATIQATFPNFTAVALASTQAQIDAATGAVGTTGVTLLASAGANFATNPTDGLSNPAAGNITAKLQGTTALTAVNTSGTITFTFNGNVVTSGLTGPGLVPIGGILIWPTNTLPNSMGLGTFAWCNGAAISRTTYAALYTGNPGSIGTTYGHGDGSTTFNLPNYQEVTLVGQSGMGGAASPGLLASISSSIKAVLAGIFGLDTYTQAQSDLPNVKPAFTGIAGELVVGSTGDFLSGTGVIGGVAGASGPGDATTGGALGGVTSSGTFTPSGTVASINGNVTQTAMPTHQPSQTTNFIIRIS